MILTKVIDHIYRTNHDIQVGSLTLSTEAEQRVAEGKVIIETISKLKYEMGRDKALEPISDDRESHVELYNYELAELKKVAKDTWFTAPWLFAECYLYRLIRSYFSQTRQWKNQDPFVSQKNETFQKSSVAIYQLATSMHELEAEKDLIASDPDKLSVLFKEMIQMCLWGNATDLSLLTHMTAEDISQLQTVGREAQESRQKFILRDDQDKVWTYVQTLKDARIDLVLDNAGFELFTDFVFADFLVTYTPYVSKVVFHPKLIPWFVSDVTPPDVVSTIECLLDPAFFSSSGSPSADHLQHIVSRWSSYISNGTFSLSVSTETPLGGDGGSSLAEFWTTPYPYWDMQSRDPKLWNELKDSALVVFKGDLNYRKLTGDVKWPASTPFETAIGPLGGSFPILSLRTNKADIAVGLDQSVVDQLDKSDEKWRIDGRYALVSFLERSNA